MKGKDCECGAPGSTLKYRCQKNTCGRRVAAKIDEMCKRSVCECGFPYSWAEKEPYLRAEKQCKMADMIKPKRYDGKMPDDIEGFFNEKTRVTETENEVSRTLILGNSDSNHHINSDTLNCKDAMGITAVNTYGATKEELFNRPINIDATTKMMLWSIKGMHAAARI